MNCGCEWLKFKEKVKTNIMLNCTLYWLLGIVKIEYGSCLLGPPICPIDSYLINGDSWLSLICERVTQHIVKRDQLKYSIH